MSNFFKRLFGRSARKVIALAYFEELKPRLRARGISDEIIAQVEAAIREA
jgi:hypothetical protein